MTQPMEEPRRTRLNRDRVLRAAVALADEAGIEALSMRKLAEELGVVPMALYKHVASKEELLDGMVDIVIGEVGPPAGGASWKSAIRQRILSARRSLQPGSQRSEACDLIDAYGVVDPLDARETQRA